MRFFITTFLVFFFVFAAFSGVAEAAHVRVPPCDKVCSRIRAERNECCKAHGHKGMYSCNKGHAVCY